MTHRNRSKVIRMLMVVLTGVLLVGAERNGPTAAGQTAAARTYFTDVVLVNQDGREMAFYSDLLEGKVVLMIPFFTTCTGVCPPMNRNLERIQDWLGERLGKDVHMMSISVDPETDTVPRLKEYSKRFHAKPGWYFLGGSKENVELALKKIGQYVQQRDDHSNILIIGNLRTGLWKKAFALAPMSDLIPIVDSVLSDKGALGSD